MGAEAVAASPLFDEEWYAAQVGRSFGSRAEAAAHYVEHAATSPPTTHPLFEPAWLYPAGRWRETAPDPLSHYLARADRGTLSTHPLLPDHAEDFVAAAGPTTLLPKTTGRRVPWGEVRAAAFATLAGEGSLLGDPGLPDPGSLRLSVVIGVTDRFAPVCRWMRRLYRAHVKDEPGVEIVVEAIDPVIRRLALVTALSLPGCRVARPGDTVGGQVTVRIDDPGLQPPEWPWLHHLLDRLADPAVGRVAPLLVEPDQTVVAAAALPGSSGAEPFLRGETPADAARMAHLPVPELWPGVVAYRTAEGPRDPAYVVPAARVVVPSPGPVVEEGRQARLETSGADLWLAAGFEGPGGPLRVVEGRLALRWAVDIAAPLAPRGRRWGDDPFARSLAAALERLGQRVTVDHPETRSRASRDHDDVVLVLRGLQPVAVTRADADVPARLLWVISHPGEVTEAECAPYDVVLAASPTWAAERTAAWGRPILPLLQCTDATLFRPGRADPDSGPEVLFVGNSRGGPRPVVRGALDAGLPLTLYGDGWDGLVDRGLVAGRSVPNDELGGLYAAAGVVLSDHWADMRALGFVSNRTFDVLACAGRLFSDDVPGLDALFEGLGTSAPTWSDPADLRRLGRPGWRDAWPEHAARVAAAERVVADHSFDARARALLDHALATVGR